MMNLHISRKRPNEGLHLLNIYKYLKYKRWQHLFCDKKGILFKAYSCVFVGFSFDISGNL